MCVWFYRSDPSSSSGLGSPGTCIIRYITTSTSAAVIKNDQIQAMFKHLTPKRGGGLYCWNAFKRILWGFSRTTGARILLTGTIKPYTGFVRNMVEGNDGRLYMMLVRFTRSIPRLTLLDVTGDESDSDPFFSSSSRYYVGLRLQRRGILFQTRFHCDSSWNDCTYSSRDVFNK